MPSFSRTPERTTSTSYPGVPLFHSIFHIPVPNPHTTNQPSQTSSIVHTYHYMENSITFSTAPNHTPSKNSHIILLHRIPPRYAARSIPQCRHSSQETWFHLLFLHLLLPLRLSLCCICFNASRVPAHVIASDREEQSINRAPREQDADIEPDPWVQVKENLARRLDD